MNKQNDCPDIFSQTILQAVDSLKKCNINKSFELISRAHILDPGAAEPHNLLGILSELKGDDIAARKHYRAAYALNPTYKPSCRNLERLCIFTWGSQSRIFDFGDESIDDVDGGDTK